MNVPKRSPKEIAEEIKRKCDVLGWRCYANSDILTITKTFTPNDRKGLVECDGEYYGILSLLPRTRPGSDWGTDCGGVGALSALKEGYFRMNRSGGNKFVLRELSKMG